MELTESTSPKTTVPRLTRLKEFEAVLKDYHVSAEAQRILDETKFALLIGPSSSGRNTIINKLVGTGHYHFIISDTTRPPRTNDGVLEQNGVEYWFRTEDDLFDDLKAGKFLEAELIHGQQVSGISIRELGKAHDNHKIAITDIDIGGIYNVVRAKPDTAIILILPPDYEEWKRRLKARGVMSDEEYRRRIQTALRIFSAPLEHDYFKIVVNNDLDEAVAQVDKIAQTGEADPAVQEKGLHLAKELLGKLRQELGQGG